MDDRQGANRQDDEQRAEGEKTASKGINPVQHSERGINPVQHSERGINPVQHSEGRQSGGEDGGGERGDG